MSQNDERTLSPEPATSRLDLQNTEIGSVFVSNYPPFSAWTPDASPALDRALDDKGATDTPLGLYVHIPFCRKRCKFCYFRVYTDKNASSIAGYIQALHRELRLYADRAAFEGRRLQFVYFGGGTPSYLSAEQISELFEGVDASFPLAAAEEVAFECEPGTLKRDKVGMLAEQGVTRLSVGIESFDDRVLELNGRAHVSKEIHRSMPWVMEAGFASVNIDLIAGMVGATFESWRHSVKETIAYAPDSVTIYQMELPFNTEFSKQSTSGELAEPLADWATKRRWHAYAVDELRAAGYSTSSAYTMVKSKKTRFVYRDALWHGADMIALGVSSFGHVSGVHYQNEAGWDRYMGRVARGELPVARAFETDEEDRLRRELLLQLKLGRTERDYFERKFGAGAIERLREPLERLQSEKLLRLEDDSIELTPDGLLRVDSFLPELYAPEYQGARYT